MATPTTNDAPLFTYQGRQVTYNQFRYLTALDNQKVLAQVNQLAMAESRQVVSVASGLSQQEMGGFLRSTLPALVDKFGNINGAHAVAYYQASRDAWMSNRQVALRSEARKGQRRRADRFALAKLQGQIYKATLPTFDTVAKAEPVLNYAMKLFMSDGFNAMDTGIQNSLTRAVASYHRDTMLYNSALDDSVVKVQRVADANACAFCQMIAFESTGGSYVKVGDYAADYHDHCHCSIETLYEGDKPIRPDYYDQFEQNYVDASVDVGSSNAKDLLAQIRKNTGAR